MKKKDIKTIKKAIESTQSHGVSDTFKFKSGVNFFVKTHHLGYQLVIMSGYDLEVVFGAKEDGAKDNFLLFLSSLLEKNETFN